MKTLHFDCFAGISGDMTLGALVALGVDPGYLRTELQKLPVKGWSLDFRTEERCGINGIRAIVKIDGDEHEHHHHEHAHEHDEHNHEHGHEHDHHEHDEHHHHKHEHDAHHHHEHGEHSHDHEHGEHSHNQWKDIRHLIENSSLKHGVKARALDIFGRIAVAEAEVHGRTVDEVAFHEVGAVDSIIDIVGAAICLDVLQPERITASPVELGGGTVTCAHGILPVPAPATLILCKGIPVTTGNFNKEMTTPTGAGILASCVDEFIRTGDFTELKTAYGIGSRKFDKPNALRVSWREEAAAPLAGKGPWTSETLVQIETSIDDMSGEALGFLMERLFEAGALDVNFIQCIMKKSRPGVITAVLCAQDALAGIREVFLKHSSTLGFRQSRLERVFLERKEERLESSSGLIRKKAVFVDGQEARSKIEFEDRARIAKEKNISLEEAEKYIRGETGWKK